MRQESSTPLTAGRYRANTDGACFGNPDGPGGWAAVVESLDASAAPWELWGYLRSTSNNRAEALGVLAALEWVPEKSSLLVRSDSQLTLKVLAGAYKAKANMDIWSEVRRVIPDKHLQVSTEGVRGHAGDPGNERADSLSVLGALNGDLVGWAARGRSDARARPAQPSASTNVPEALAGVQARGAWETSFLQSVAKQLRGGRALSEKQQAIVDRMKGRATE